MYKLLRPLLFRLNPERAHHLTFSMLEAAKHIPGALAIVGGKRPPTQAAVEVMGLQFPGPVGLAAGMDKDAKHVDALARIGFGFVEVGTLTPVAQPGNERPRLFRLKADRALINRMGFNNGGVQDAVERLRKRTPGIVVGGNIGKNKVTPNEQAIADYVKCFEALHPVVDYFVVNVSSPNTPGLRALQEKGPLLEILQELKHRADEHAVNGDKSLVNSPASSHQSPTTIHHSPFTIHHSPITIHQSPKPILLKIAPDLTDEQLDDIVTVVQESGIAGVVATNTTISRAGLKMPKAEVDALGAGGVSGAPVRARSTEVVKYLRARLPRPVVIIGVGGIDSAEAAMEKLDAGADLVQVFTGLIYEGPALLKRINAAYASLRRVEKNHG
ncbi:MAG: quinone-dependent dihydroorotate dehydrogenase [Bacteroidetes bacterium]|nr:quinone-dependent dihydroorotate dehydrogenase [Bacteroidota bacterium]